jgi:hypothetical protein
MMKPIANCFTPAVARRLMAATMVVMTTSAIPAFASTDLVQRQGNVTAHAPLLLAQSTSTQTSAPKPSATAGNATQSAADPIDARIAQLHSKLKITKAQEDPWNKVADVMRENSKAMELLRKERTEKAKTMTAVGDLKSYAEITEAHASSIKKFIPVFEALYDSMSDDQKNNADHIFSNYGLKSEKQHASKKQ